ncbi:MotE family protein [Aquisalinus flavus]|uniref:Uncharacterized protein n=1 Tax=Aquisalinus flavus TaxID=1526572 RepID=A0A8J2Y5X0_9PROT|nr:hypothetical protein [Aquisalinus flavus]MBD0425250.1 hypothetical protein [Aquisalinus flavus]UNE49093.1 hypothetical protein FF099_14045 [Aquisalinus flavus]GGD17553.1 hypothetical protein GCM10011342_27950 [Aquisalinus flavus]
MRNNVLLVLASLFALSMIGRSFAMSMSTTGTAVMTLAQDLVARPQTDGEEEDRSLLEDIQTPTEFFNEDVCATGDMLAAIKEREADLLEREDAHAERMKSLEAVETRVEERMAMLDQMNDKLSTAMAAIEAESDQDITHLAAMYENMKPAEASKIFNQMDPSFAAGFLRIMNSTNAGMIMAGMEPEKAYSISVVLANRNAGYRDALSN